MGDSDIEMIPAIIPYFSSSWRKVQLECLAGKTRPGITNKKPAPTLESQRLIVKMHFLTC